MYRLLMLFVCVLLSSISGHALAVTVDCSAGQTISAAVNALTPSTQYITINVSGACTDNVYVGPGLALALVGAPGTTLTPLHTKDPTIYIEGGHLYVERMTLKTGLFAAVFINHGGFAVLSGDKFLGPGTQSIQVSDKSGAQIFNSQIKSTGQSGINLYDGSSVEIDGGSTFDGITGVTISGAQQFGILCSGGQVAISANGGPVSISNNGQVGVSLNSCQLQTYVASGYSISFNQNGTSANYGTGVGVVGNSYAQLAGVTIANNGFTGVFVRMGATSDITGSTITGNQNTAIQASQNGVVDFQSWNGASTVTAPPSATGALFSCYQGGKIYVDQISNAITPAPTPSNIGCLTVGGP